MSNLKFKRGDVEVVVASDDMVGMTVGDRKMWFPATNAAAVASAMVALSDELASRPQQPPDAESRRGFMAATASANQDMEIALSKSIVDMNTSLFGAGMVGHFRLYFNRHGRAGLPACVCMAPKDRLTASKVMAVAEAGMVDSSLARDLLSSEEPLKWEIAVRGWHTVGVATKTVYRPKSTSDDDDGVPSFWVEANGTLVMSDGIAVIRPVMKSDEKAVG